MIAQVVTKKLKTGLEVEHTDVPKAHTRFQKTLQMFATLLWGGGLYSFSTANRILGLCTHAQRLACL